MMAMLREANIVGGGFALISSLRIPQVVADHAVGILGAMGSVGSAASVASTLAGASSQRRGSLRTMRRLPRWLLVQGVREAHRSWSYGTLAFMYNLCSSKRERINIHTTCFFPTQVLILLST